MSANPLSAAPAYTGPVFDCDSHIHEHDLEFFKEYLPAQYHAKWLPARKVGANGEFGLYIGDRRVHNAEANAEGLVPPPGKPDSQPIGRQRLYHRSRSPPRMTEPV